VTSPESAAEDPAAEDPAAQVSAAEDPAAPVSADQSSGTPAAAASTSAARSIWLAMRPRATRAQFLAGLLCAILGFALVVQLQQTQERGLAGLRQEDLVTVLDNLNQQNQRLQADQERLRQQIQDLSAGPNGSESAQQAAQHRLDQLAILAGTAPAAGPGIRLVITDPQHKVDAATLLDTVQELRDAGAEAMQLGSVRLGAESFLIDQPTGVQVDTVTLGAPYTFLVIGPAQTLAAALDIPGGILESLRQLGATGQVEALAKVEITALRPSRPAQYARPAVTKN
jgi:uncharacterized protein YlxW (UPF0749 family)